MEVSGDPFVNYRGSFVVWVRKCYIDMIYILVNEEAKQLGHRLMGQRSILMGTGGIGKSFFTILWVCYLATRKKRIVWSVVPDLYYLLDFSQEAATVHGPVDALNHVLLQVLNDTDVWLIVDRMNGGRSIGSGCMCNILVTCFAERNNYHGFGDGPHVEIRYLPV